VFTYTFGVFFTITTTARVLVLADYIAGFFYIYIYYIFAIVDNAYNELKLFVPAVQARPL